MSGNTILIMNTSSCERCSTLATCRVVDEHGQSLGIYCLAHAKELAPGVVIPSDLFERGWRLITDDPPKDGSEIILGWRGDREALTGYWESQPNHWNETGWREEDARQGHYFHRHPLKPTHWRPLPEGPV